ncbi:hypothetical protein I5M27_17580 [Adhaeribacter sp. BT258]|uniref:Uncharacterized protein n=1 Tax=Adhaeribacter terrigena TaxID=2793070 RepID=A0ABS1C632_9BACT|nr:hypothetical protein [Adhaeribacter terrigena]MBK0404807.1 hypothetical protein [Adhaeribacter terrigena]
MEKIIGIETQYGVIKGRDGIYLDSISYPKETELILKGEFNINTDFKNFEISFSRIIYSQLIELDFDDRGGLESFGYFENSALIEKFRKIDHSNKLNARHTHYYFRTYDIVFEIIAQEYNLKT